MHAHETRRGKQAEKKNCANRIEDALLSLDHSPLLHESSRTQRVQVVHFDEEKCVYAHVGMRAWSVHGSIRDTVGKESIETCQEMEIRKLKQPIQP